MRKDTRLTWKLACLFGVLAAGALTTSINAQSDRSRATEAQPMAADQAGVDLAPGLNLAVAPASLRTNATMLAAEQTGAFPRSRAKAPRTSLRSTVDDETYFGMKAAAAATAAVSGPRGPQTDGPLGPPGFQGINVAGVNQTTACACWPPDTHGAVGNSQYVQIVNSRVVVYDKVTMAIQSSLSLSAFLGWTTNLPFDPRAVYDAHWDRWILTAEGDNVNATFQPFFIAISTGPNAAGSYWIYVVDVDFFNNTNFWDYPQLGQDIDSVMFTANIFPAAGGFAGADAFAVSKALLFNGLGWSVPVFTGLAGSLAPPIVRDDNRASFFISAPVGGAALPMYKLRDSGRGPYQTFTFVGNVAVAAFAVAPNATQPGTASTLDTLDGRFQNASSQQANFLWNTHAVAFGGPAAVRWYRINVNSLGVNQTGTHFTSASSADFNPAISTDNAERAYVVFSSTDAANGINAQIRFTGKLLADAALGASTNLFTSPTFLTQGRWGDYASVSVDPLNGTAGGPYVYVTNQTIQAATTWATRIARIGY